MSAATYDGVESFLRIEMSMWELACRKRRRGDNLQVVNVTGLVPGRVCACAQTNRVRYCSALANTYLPPTGGSTIPNNFFTSLQAEASAAH